MKLVPIITRYLRFIFLCFTVILIFSAVGGAGCAAPSNSSPPAPSQQSLPTPPNIGISSKTLSFNFKKDETSTSIKNITIMNEGERVLIWAARKSATWLWLDETDGSVNGGSSKSLQIFVSPSGRVPGTYTDNITVEGVAASNSPQIIQVTMVISPEPTDTIGSNPASQKKAVPPPPWAYNEYKNDNYNFVLRYPKDYKPKQLNIRGTVFGAIPSSSQQHDDAIMVVVTGGTYGVSVKDAAEGFVNDAIRVMGGRPNPRLISEEETTLADETTPAYELLYESRSAATMSYKCYIFGIQAKSRYIFFGAICPLSLASEKTQLWKEIARTLEFGD